MQPAAFRFIIGLGNPGRQYAGTRHNVGFMILDQLAARNGMTFRTEKKWRAELANHEGVWYCKPTSYMNRSGEPAAQIAQFYKIAISEMLVIYDDVALPLGKLRLRANGSCGGHNGLRSLVEHFGSQEIARLRVGIGSEGAANRDLTDHVLSRFTEEEKPLLQESIDRSLTAIELIQHHGLTAAMNQFN